MTDIEYMFRQDIREKKAAGRGVYGKRTGSKTKYVGLPQTHMSDAQLKRRNGPLLTYNINTFNDWTSFRNLPYDLQKTYMQNLLATYNVNAQILADTYGVHKNTFLNYLKARGIKLSFHKGGGKPRSDERWPDFVGGKLTTLGYKIGFSDTAEPEVATAPVAEPEVVTAPVTKPEVISPTLEVEFEEPKVSPAILYKVTVEMDGTPGQLADMIAMLTDKTSVYEFDLVIKEKGVSR